MELTLLNPVRKSVRVIEKGNDSTKYLEVNNKQTVSTLRIPRRDLTCVLSRQSCIIIVYLIIAHSSSINVALPFN